MPKGANGAQAKQVGVRCVAGQSPYAAVNGEPLGRLYLIKKWNM